MLKPFEIDLLRQDLQAGLERDEEAEAITRERQAFRRYQAALAAANRLFVPQADGVPTASINGDSMARIDAEAAAYAAWQTAKENCERILDEIRSGKRQ
jgi:hypothetical protein